MCGTGISLSSHEFYFMLPWEAQPTFPCTAPFAVLPAQHGGASWCIQRKTRGASSREGVLFYYGLYLFYRCSQWSLIQATSFVCRRVLPNLPETGTARFVLETPGCAAVSKVGIFQLWPPSLLQAEIVFIGFRNKQASTVTVLGVRQNRLWNATSPNVERFAREKVS